MFTLCRLRDVQCSGPVGRWMVLRTPQEIIDVHAGAQQKTLVNLVPGAWLVLIRSVGEQRHLALSIIHTLRCVLSDVLKANENR